ncbi:MFS transporter [Stenotrophomonas maltophilia]|nr:MFS transporter [Stenotrophomonas maltophilia]
MVQPYLKPVPDWEEHEKPTMPGSASMPWHPPYRRAAYALVSLLVAITGGLGNALVTANLPFLQGQLALTPTQGSWLVAAYAMVNVTANLLAFKFRQQYGIRLFAEIGLGLYAALAVLHLFVGSFETTMLTRAASGFAGAACSTLGTLYMLQALPRRFTGNLLVVGVGLSQLAVPIAWIVSPGLVDTGQWHQLYSFEAGLALCAFAAVVVLKLPPGIQVKAFEPLDFLTFALLAPAVALLVIVLAQGYTRWWLNTPWLGWALVASIVLSTTAFIIEHYRRNPLLQTRWLASLPVLHFIVGAFLIRFLTTEQSYGVVNLMRTLGMGPDQLRPLFVVILAGVVTGIAGTALTFGPKRLIPQLLMAILLLGAAAFFDQHRTSMDRPHDFYASQFLASVGAGMFMGPLIMLGISAALKQGVDHMITFLVTLSITQTLGGLAGSAVLGTFQLHREQLYSSALTSQLDPADPVVAQRLRIQQQLYVAQITDPVLRSAQGSAQLAQTTRREANVRGFNDVFTLSGWLAIGFLCWLLLLSLRTAVLKQWRKRHPTSPAVAPKYLKPSARSVVVMVVVALLGIALILRAWHLWPFTSSVMVTDNAYVRGQITVMAPQVNGYVTEVLVKDFQHVKEGEPLLRIDDRIYAQRVAQAQAALDSARAALANSDQSQAQNRAQIASARATLSAGQAELQRSRNETKRYEELAAQQLVSINDRDKFRTAQASAQASVQQSQAQIRIAEETLVSTQVARKSLEAQVESAQAQLELARIDLANTVIHAPRDGQISEASVRVGQYVAAGSQLLFLVPDTLWVVANYKEGQTWGMAIGQPATFSVDAFQGQVLRGRVQEIAPATGSEFSVLRPDNASGNFTKVVQRLPVRISINKGQKLAAQLRPGMSVIVRVDTRSKAMD